MDPLIVMGPLTGSRIGDSVSLVEGRRSADRNLIIPKPMKTKKTFSSHLPSADAARPTVFLPTISGLALAFAALCSPVVAQSTTSGFLNLARTENPGTLLSHPDDNDSADIGRTTTVQYLRGWVMIGGEAPGSRPNSDLKMRVYDISNPDQPVRKLPSDFGLSYSDWQQGNYGWNAHGSAQVKNDLFPQTIRVNQWGGTPERGGTNGIPHAHNGSPFGGWNRSAQAGAWLATMKWYGSADSMYEIRKSIPAGNGFTSKLLATFDHSGNFGGGDWHPMFFGDLLVYARSGAADRDGIVIYRMIYNDFDDPQNMSITPQFVTTLDARFQGYWPTFYGDGQSLYVVNAASGLLMGADITAASEPGGSDEIIKLPELVTPLSNAQYPVYQDQYGFIHNKKFDMNKFIAGDPNPVVLELDETANNADTTQMSLPLGNLWLTGGYQHGSRSQGMSVWVQQKAPDTTKPKVAFHIPQSGRANYPRFAPLSFLIHEVPRDGGPIAGEDFLVRKVGAGDTLGTSVTGHTIFDMSGVLTFTPDTGLDADATYQVDFIADPTHNKGFTDASGNYIEPYSFRFSTGSGVAGDPAPTITSVVSTDHHPAPNQAITVTVAATTVANPEFRFNFDGTWGPWGSSNHAAHTYTGEGRERVLVQARDDSGYVTTGSVRLVVLDVPTGSPGTQSSTMAVGTDSGDRHLWVVNPDANSVAVLDAASGTKVTEFAVGKNPQNIARDANGRYWVSCFESDEIWILEWDGGTGGVVAHEVLDVGYGSGPFGVCASPDGQFVYVGYQNRAMLVRFAVGDPLAPDFVNSVPTPRALAVSGDGTRVFATRFISSDGEGQVGEYLSNASGFTYKRKILLGYSRVPDGGDRAAGVPNYLTGIAISPDGKYALVTSKQDNIARGEAFGVGDLTHETTTRAIVSVIDLTSNQERPGGRRDFDDSEGPSAVTFTPLGDIALVTLRGNNRLVGFDTLDLHADVNVTAQLTIDAATGMAPRGVLVDPLTDRIFTQDFMDREVRIFDAEPLLERNQTSVPTLAEISTVAAELLAPAVLEGKRIFYNAADERMSAEGYISCATCHLDGGHDGRTWDFTGRGEGFRRTTDLRGRSGTGHGNVHWSGNFDEIQDFEHDMRGPFGGTGFLPLNAGDFAVQHPGPGSTKAGLSPELDALAAYVSSLGTESIPRSPHRETNGALTASAVSGKQVFDSMNCATCHSGEDFTDSPNSDVSSISLHDVGTLSELSGERLGAGALPGIDTPSLLGLHAGRTFLHNGLAASVDQVFNYVGGELHQAEDGEQIWTLNDRVSVKTEPVNEGGGGYSRGPLGGKWLEVKTDQENSDVNGNGVIDTYPTGVRFTGIDGGSGGSAQLALRYVVRYGDGTARLRVNGIDQTLALKRQSPDTGWMVTGWRWIQADITLNTGTGNVIEITKTGGADLELDAIIVGNSDILATANPHRQVTALPQADRDDLVSWLLQLDGRDENGNLGPDLVPATLLTWEFADGPKTPGSVPPTGRDEAIAVGSTINIGAGLYNGNDNTHYAHDAFATTRANATSLAGAVSGNDYISWKLSPAAGRVVSLDSITLGIFEQVTNSTFNYELRVSANPGNFAGTYQRVALGPDGLNGQPGTGLWRTAGIAASGSLAGIAGLDQLDGSDEVEFRLYLWGTGFYNGIGIGKLGDTTIDLAIQGAVDGVAIPSGNPSGGGPPPGPKLTINVWDGANSLSPADGWVTSGALPTGYSDPVILANLAATPGQPAAVAMVRPVAGSNDRYEIKVKQAALNPQPTAEYAVTVLVMDAGAYIGWEAGSVAAAGVDQNDSWIGQRVQFQNPYTDPLVFGQVVVPAGTEPDWSVFWTARDDNGLLARGDRATGSSAFVGHHVGEDTSTVRPAAILNYLVVERGALSIDGRAAYAEHTGATIAEIDQVNGPGALDLSSSGFSGISSALTGMQQMVGGNGGWAVTVNPNPINGNYVTVAVEEDDVADSDNDHIEETLGVLIFEDE